MKEKGKKQRNKRKQNREFWEKKQTVSSSSLFFFFLSPAKSSSTNPIFLPNLNRQTKIQLDRLSDSIEFLLFRNGMAQFLKLDSSRWMRMGLQSSGEFTEFAGRLYYPSLRRESSSSWVLLFSFLSLSFSVEELSSPLFSFYLLLLL